LSAIILGDRSELDLETKNLFSQTGISHIISISGMHISIVSILTFWILIYFGLSRKKAFYFIVIFLIFYLCLIGFIASAIRAVIMGLILMYGYKEGRLANSGRALVFAAGILLLINPRLLRWDVGFQLSFLATFGIIYFYNYINNFLNKVRMISEKINAILAVTLSAQVLTLPLVFYYFNVFSYVSPITNLLVIPVLPVILIFGLLLISIGFIWSKIAFVLSIFIYFILEYIIKISEILT